MWIFGYGSLVWKVDFPYTQKLVGYIKGYDRRFWQASIDHRGTPEKPGRVVTLVPSADPEAKVWGLCFCIEDKAAIEQLNEREKRFSQITLDFIFCPEVLTANSANFKASDIPSVLKAVTYIGPENGPLFLGNASIEDIVKQIAEAKGPSGLNSEYIFRLAAFMRTTFPNVRDDHLFEIENSLRAALSKVWGAAYEIEASKQDEVLRHLDHREIMGYEKVPIQFYPIANHPLNQISESEIVKDNAPHISPFQVTMYYGSNLNEHYLGEAAIDVIAQKISETTGPSGSNKDYLLNLINALKQIRDLLPEKARKECFNNSDDILDSHLTLLESAVMKLEKPKLQ